MKIIQNKKTNICILIYSVLISFAFVFGRAIYLTNDITYFAPSFRVLTKNMFLILALTVVAYFLFSIFVIITNKLSNNSNQFIYKRGVFPFLLIVFFVCWIPVFIAYYPGIWSYDINVQIWQISGNYNTYHPPIQTFILACFLKLSNNNYSNALSYYSIAQMVFLASVFSHVICKLIKQKFPKVIIVVSFIFYALNPVIAIFSQIPVKDVLCGGFLVLLSLSIYELSSYPLEFFNSIPKQISLIVEILLFCLFRNNAIYALLVSIPFFIIVFRKNLRHILFCFITPVILFFFVCNIIYPKLGVEKVSGAEILSVPLQQIANVVTNCPEDLTEEDKEAIDCFIPYDDIPKLYNPRFADPFCYIYDNSKGIVHVLEEWLRLFPGHVKEYINAFLSLNIPMWYPNATPCDPISGVQYIETNVTIHNVNAPFENAGLSPALLSFYENIATYSYFSKLPQFFNVFTLSFAIWFLLLCFFMLVINNNSLVSLTLCIPFFFWSTYLLCPVSNLRYILPIMMLYPIFLSLLISKRK